MPKTNSSLLQFLHTNTTFNETIEKFKESLRSERYSYLAEALHSCTCPLDSFLSPSEIQLTNLLHQENSMLCIPLRFCFLQPLLAYHLTSSLFYCLKGSKQIFNCQERRSTSCVFLNKMLLPPSSLSEEWDMVNEHRTNYFSKHKELCSSSQTSTRTVTIPYILECFEKSMYTKEDL